VSATATGSHRRRRSPGAPSRAERQVPPQSAKIYRPLKPKGGATRRLLSRLANHCF